MIIEIVFGQINHGNIKNDPESLFHTKELYFITHLDGALKYHFHTEAGIVQKLRLNFKQIDLYVFINCY